jgi:hypothetical protein
MHAPQKPSRLQSPLLQLALIVGALIVGILLDRLLLSPASSTADARAAAAEHAKASAGASTSSSSESSSNPTRGTAATSQSSKTAALDSILTKTDPRQRLRELQAYIDGLTPNTFPDAIKRIDQIPNRRERALASLLLVNQWLQVDPDGALQFAAGNRDYSYLASDVFKQWAEGDFDAAVKRALAIPGNDLRYHALVGVVSYRADSEPESALKLAQSFGDFRGYEPFSNMIYRQWAKIDPPAAALHATSQPVPPGENWRSPIASVVRSWAEKDPVAAANWSLAVQDTQIQERSISQVMREWAPQDPKGAANWIYTLDDGPAHDAAIAAYGQSLISTDPQTGLSWISSINNPDARVRALQRISGEVMWRDPQNGAAMLQAAGLPADLIKGRRGERR